MPSAIQAFRRGPYSGRVRPGYGKGGRSRPEPAGVLDVPRRLPSLFVLVLLTACGGGGGGGDGGIHRTPGFLPTGSLSGTIQFTTGLAAVVLEAEPNDALGEAQVVGDLPIGGRVTILGRLAEPGDADLLDGFRLRVPQRARITATLVVENPAVNDFDLALYDPVALQFVETWPSSDAAHQSRFHAKGVVDLVVSAVAGEGAYELVVSADAPATAVGEREPNDAPGEAQYLGEVVSGDRITIEGAADPSSDPVDALLVVCPEALTLQVAVTTAAFATFSLDVLDATADLLAPVPFASLPPAEESPRTLTRSVPAGTLLHVAISTSDRGGAWRLELEGLAQGASEKARNGRPAARVSRVEAEADRLARRVRARYGRPTVELAPGEALLRYRDPGEGGVQVEARSAKAVSGSGQRFRRVQFDLPEGIDAEDRARYTLSRVAALAGASGMLYCEPNYIRHPLAEPDDTYYGLQWHYPMIHLPEAWDLSTGDPGVIVAVIDTGRTNHPDLAQNQSGGFDMISSTFVSRDGDGYDGDPTDVGDLSRGSTSSWHGTHVAGTIGARSNNGSGVSGVNWSCSIMHVRALGRGGGTVADIANAVRYAAGLANDSGALPSQPAHVINMSLGGSGYSQTMADACQAAWAAGTVIFASAGNSSTTDPSYPAAYSDVISVMAVDASRTRAPYSNWGAGVELAAPGGNTAVDLTADGYPDGVLSTLWDESSSPKSPVYAFYQGTSMASPHAAGVAALMLSVNPSLTPGQIRVALWNSADDLGASGTDDVYGRGLVNAYRALVEVGGAPPPADPILSLTPTSLNFGTTRSSMEVSIDNLGGGLLVVGPVSEATTTGVDWLSTELLGPADELRSARTLRVEVNRFGLLSGTYQGIVTVASNAGAIEIPVVLGVESTPTPPPYLDIFVQVISAETGEVVAKTAVNPAGSLDFSLPVVPVGTYLVVAGTDLDGDGTLCEDGDYCGAWPLLGEPATVQVIQGLESAHVDFQVGLPATVGR